jgi:hypothetical protein
MQNRLILAWVLAVFTAGTISAKAGLGWTFDECKQHYGQPVSKPIGSEGKRKAHLFSSKDYIIVVWFLHDRVSRVCYGKKSGAQLSVGEVNDLLTTNVPEDVEWSVPTKDEASDQYWRLGTKKGEETPTYVAVQSKQGSLCIFTDEDDWYVSQKNKEVVEDL